MYGEKIHSASITDTANESKNKFSRKPVKWIMHEIPQPNPDWSETETAAHTLQDIRTGSKVKIFQFSHVSGVL